jgi:hypothetical protein
VGNERIYRLKVLTPVNTKKPTRAKFLWPGGLTHAFTVAIGRI